VDHDSTWSGHLRQAELGWGSLTRCNLGLPAFLCGKSQNTPQLAAGKGIFGFFLFIYGGLLRIAIGKQAHPLSLINAQV